MKNSLKIGCLIPLALLIVVGWVNPAQADEVTDLINKAMTYESNQSVQYDVTETYQNDLTHKTTVKRYAVLKKGQNEVRTDADTGNLNVKKGGKQKFMVQGSVVESSTIGSIFSLFLDDYQSGKIKAMIVTKNETIVLKGTREGYKFKAVFSKDPVLLLACDSQDKTGDSFFEGDYSYDFNADPVRPVKAVESGTLVENGNVISKYKKKLEYKNYVKAIDLAEDVFSDETVTQQKVVKKVRVEKKRK